MTTLTLHALDESLAKTLVNRAKQNGKSLNETAKELLTSALGLSPAKRIDRHEEFARFSGILSDKDARSIQEGMADFSKIDRELWK